MKFGLSDEWESYLVEKVIAPLSQQGLKVFIFGSRARGDFKPFSDVDLMIEGKRSPQIESMISALQEDLSKSNFPVKVDLVFLEDFAKSYLDSYYLDRKEF